jgi:hypothetical protein
MKAIHGFHPSGSFAVQNYYPVILCFAERKVTKRKATHLAPVSSALQKIAVVPTRHPYRASLKQTSCLFFNTNCRKAILHSEAARRVKAMNGLNEFSSSARGARMGWWDEAEQKLDPRCARMTNPYLDEYFG